jgi:DNA-binding GntR family transcriptional regulator
MKDQAMGRKSATFEADDAKLPLDRKAALSLALRHRILTMELQPGAVLDEVLLSEEFGLSRPPVRELLREMAGEGFVELEANRAARVASMSFHSLRNFFLAAPMIYIATTKLAAEASAPPSRTRMSMTVSTTTHSSICALVRPLTMPICCQACADC